MTLAPPPGPGVQAPFVRPPTDGTRQRRNLALVLSAVAVAVCCIGGLLSIGGLVVFGGRMIEEKSHAAVVDFLTSIKNAQFGEAYRQQCPAEQNREGEAEFIREWMARPRLDSFDVHTADVANDISVPATLRFVDGTTTTATFVLVQNPETTAFEVCGSEV